MLFIKKKFKDIMMPFLLMFVFIFLTMPCVEVKASGVSDYHDLKITITSEGPNVNGGTTTKEAFTEVIAKYQKIISIIGAFAVVSMVLFFIKSFIKLGVSADNPVARKEAVKGCLWSGIATAAMGVIGLITYLFYSFGK